MSQSERPDKAANTSGNGHESFGRISERVDDTTLDALRRMTEGKESPPATPEGTAESLPLGEKPDEKNKLIESPHGLDSAEQEVPLTPPVEATPDRYDDEIEKTFLDKRGRGRGKTSYKPKKSDERSNEQKLKRANEKKRVVIADAETRTEPNEAESAERWRSLQQADTIFDTVRGDKTIIVEIPGMRPDGNFWVRNISKKNNVREYWLSPKLAEEMLTSKNYVLNPSAPEPLSATEQKDISPVKTATQRDADNAEASLDWKKRFADLDDDLKDKYRATKKDAVPVEEKKSPVATTEAPKPDPEPSPKESEKTPAAWPDVKIGDSFVEKKTGERIVILNRVEDPSKPEGGYYDVRLTAKNKKPREYNLDPSVVAKTLRDHGYRLDRAQAASEHPTDAEKPSAVAPAERSESGEPKKEQKTEEEPEAKFKEGARVVIVNERDEIISERPVTVEKSHMFQGKRWYAFKEITTGFEESRLQHAGAESEPLERADEHIKDVPEVHEILRKEEQEKQPLERAGEHIKDVPEVHDILKKEEEDKKEKPLERADEHIKDIPEITEQLGTKEEEEKLEISEAAFVEKLPTKDKKNLFEGLANIGFSIQAVKSRMFKKAFEQLERPLPDKEKQRVGGSFGDRFIRSYIEHYQKQEQEAMVQKEQTGKRFAAKSKGVIQGLANGLKYGRIFYDVAKNGSLKYANPFRHVTLAAMFAGQNAQMAKEARFKAEEVVDASRVADIDRAQEEAQGMYDSARATREGEVPDADDLNKAYLKFIPSDVVKRLNRSENKGVFMLSNLMQKFVEGDVTWATKRIQKKIEAIESSELAEQDKKQKTDLLLARQKKFLADMDRMVSDAGAVDQFAYWGYQLEKAGKNTANIMMLDTARLMLVGAAEHLGMMERFSHDIDSVAPDQHTAEAVPASVHEQVPSPEQAEPAQVPPVKAEEVDSYLHESELRHDFSSHEAIPDGQAAVEHSAVGAEQPVPVEIHKGEGMIQALGRTLEQQYHLDHEKAMDVANRVYAEQKPESWFNTVHEGDAFKVNVSDVDAERMKTGTVDDVAHHIKYQNESFSYEKSGMAPSHELPLVDHADEVPASRAPRLTPEQIYEHLSHSEHIASVELAVAQYLAQKGITFNPDTSEISYDMDRNGIISDKEVVMKLGGHLDTIGAIKIRMNAENGSCIVETMNMTMTMKEVIELPASFDPVNFEATNIHGYLEHVIPPPSTETIAAASTMLEFHGKVAHKLHDVSTDISNAGQKLEHAHRGMNDTLASMRADQVPADKSTFIKLVQHSLKLTKPEAKQIGKPIHEFFTLLRKEGVAFSSRDTLGSVLKRLDLKE